MPKIPDILIALNYWGFKHTLRTIKYTVFRDWLNWKYSRQKSHHNPETAGNIVEVKPNSNHAQEILFTNFKLEIQFLAQRIIRIKWSRLSDTDRSPVPYALAQTTWSPVIIEHQSTSSGEIFISNDLQIHLGIEGDISFLNHAGQVVHRDKSPQLTEKGWLLQTLLTPEECIYGLGEQSEGLNLRGSTHRFVNTDAGGSYGPDKDPLYMPFPVYIGINDRGQYLVFHENTYPGTIIIDPPPDLNEDNKIIPDTQIESLLHTEFESPTLQYYVILGHPPLLLELYTRLTGRAPLPPLWSLGYHQSRWGYVTEKDIRAVVEGFEDHKMPVSAFHLDIDYMNGYRVFTIDHERFPDLGKLADDLMEASIRLVAILDPGVKIDPDYQLYQEGLLEDVFCTLPNGKPVHGLVWPGWSVYPDFTSAKTRRWWGSKYPILQDVGISGFWHDMNEPTSFSSWGGLYLPRPTRYNLDGRSGDHHEAHNVYALQMNRAGYEALQQSASDKRPWLLSRSGWAGNQRYAWNWTGDTESTWDSLKMTITTILGMGLSGIPFVGSDIGGFSGNPTSELYLRWFQLAAFIPFFRTHSAVGTQPREPWVYGEPYTSMLRDILQLRYRLIPYLYTLAWETSQTGAPLIRPLFWNHPDLQDYWHVKDEFFLGDALLVAPILEAACQKRIVLFPPGQWFNYWDDTEVVTGPSTLSINPNLETIPVYVRSGTGLPMNLDGQLELHVYPPSLNPKKDVQYKGYGQCYLDQGEGFGLWRLDQFRFIQTGNLLEINWETMSETNRKAYPFPYRSITIVLHGADALDVQIDGLVTAYSGKRFTSLPFKQLHLRLAIDA